MNTPGNSGNFSGTSTPPLTCGYAEARELGELRRAFPPRQQGGDTREFPNSLGLMGELGNFSKWDVRFLNLAAELARWSSCRRDQVGAVIASPDHDVVATGFNDTPAGWANCGDGGCPRADRPSVSGSPQLDDEVCLHAESNALQRAGLRARGAVMYVTRQPCAQCRRQALTAGIARIVVKETA